MPHSKRGSLSFSTFSESIGSEPFCKSLSVGLTLFESHCSISSQIDSPDFKSNENYRKRT
jgi:hypothetical protein